jgi:lipopolysaccharide transport system permease protein
VISATNLTTSDPALPAAQNTTSDRVTSILPPRSWASLGIRELWEARELVGFLAWRDVKVRYAQTLLGASWAVLQPLLTMAVFSLVFGRLARLPTDGVPYPVFVLAALTPWTFFALSLQNASHSLVQHQSLLRKIYFPRQAIPVAAVLAATVDYALTVFLLLVVAAWYGVPLTPHLLWTLPLSLIAAAAALGVGMALAALNVVYRDVRYVLPFLVQLWMFSSPIVYSTGLLPERWHTWYAVNPLVAVIEGYRWAVFGSSHFSTGMLMVAVASAAGMLWVGAVCFRQMERHFADLA